MEVVERVAARVVWGLGSELGPVTRLVKERLTVARLRLELELELGRGETVKRRVEVVEQTVRVLVKWRSVSGATRQLQTGIG